MKRVRVNLRMGPMGVVLCESLCVEVIVVVVTVIVIVIVLNNIDPVTESVFARDNACAVVGKMRCHIQGKMGGCVLKRGCEVAADDDCAVRLSVVAH